MKIITAACCFATLLLVGCRSAAPAPGADALIGIDWVLKTVNSGDGSTTLVPDGKPPMLRFDSGDEGVRVSGFSGVNRFTGSCTLLDDGGLGFSPLASTRMAGPAEAMELERQFLARLQAARSFALEGAQLEILTESGSLEFSAE